MKWLEIRNEKDIEHLLETFGGFHDSCLKELYMSTDSYVDKNLAMGVSPLTNVRILFQRQLHNPSAIELLFEGVAQLHIVPRPDNYDAIILDAKLILHNNLFYWANSFDWDPEDESLQTDSSWIAAKNLKWRDVSSWMGKQNRYGVLE